MNIKQEKRCIVHIPNHIEKSGKSGSNIRPIKMKQAFEENGYLVEYISGYGTERKVQINKIKRNIRNGIKYDFLYSESSTMPTLLTEKNHLPRYPFLDFSFFKFCKKNGITGIPAGEPTANRPPDRAGPAPGYHSAPWLCGVSVVE